VVCTVTTSVVTRNGKKISVSRQRCNTKLVSGPVTFTTSGRVRASVSRDGVTYAVGTETGSHLLLRAVRRTPAGRYALKLVRRDGTTRRTTERSIVIR
jgi:hypothetical protein